MPLLRVRGIERTTPGFRAEFLRMAKRLGLAPDPIAAVMALESGFDAQAVNPDGGATGLIQFMPPTAKRLGTTTEALRRMNATAQLRYVELFFRGVPALRAGSRAGDYYLATFMPAFINLPDAVPIAFKGDNIYKSNSGLDGNKDGILTVGDVRSKLENELARAARLPPLQVDENVPSDASDDGTPGDDLSTLFVIAAAGVGAWWWLKRKGKRS